MLSLQILHKKNNYIVIGFSDNLNLFELRKLKQRQYYGIWTCMFESKNFDYIYGIQ